jgi:hypothetical protein
MDRQSIEERLQSQYRMVVEKLQGIKLVRFVDTPAIVEMVLDGKIPYKRLDLLDLNSITEDQQIEWIKKILKGEKIVGKFLFAFSSLPFAEVVFDSSFEWILPLWRQRSTSRLQLVNLHGNYLLTIRWTENCFENNCLIAESAEQQETH